MIYTPEITEVTIADESGDAVATVRWVDEASLIVQAERMITNSQDWPGLSVAIQAAIIRMEQSVRKAQENKA